MSSTPLSPKKKKIWKKKIRGKFKPQVDCLPHPQDLSFLFECTVVWFKWYSATLCRKKNKTDNSPPPLPWSLAQILLVWQVHETISRIMCAKFLQHLQFTGPAGPDCLKLLTVLSASPSGHLVHSYRYRAQAFMSAVEVSMWTALLLLGL